VEFLGYDTQRVRYLVLIASAFFAGISGGLAAINFEIVTAENVSAVRSGGVLLAAFIGGAMFFFGPIVGSVIFVLFAVALVATSACESTKSEAPGPAAVAAQPATPLDEIRLAGMDMLYSSGTTGKPKGVTRAFPGTPLDDASGAVAPLLQMLFGVTADSIYLSPAPFYHAAPLRFCMSAMGIGCTVVAMEHFDAEQYLALVERHHVTTSQVVPTMFVRMLKLAPEVRTKYDVSSLQCVIHAAAPCPIPVKQQMIEWFGPIIHEYYAGTEGNGFVYCNSDMWLAHPGTVGTPINCTLHICGDDGEEVPHYESGTVFFEGGASLEYHNDPEKTASSRHPKGWSTLGDVGYVDDDNFLYLTDRKAYMIISGGVNIYPQESENLLVTHPKVVDVAVFGVPNDDFGEEVKAVVQPVTMPADADAAKALEKELIAFCRSELADVKCPRSIDFRDELPRHPTGKLYKRLLQDEEYRKMGYDPANRLAGKKIEGS
jgi:acyl-CoA synthetase (AMP-forming)/AMP-acid ligase II